MVDDAPNRRLWQVKMLALAAEAMAGGEALREREPAIYRAPTWERLVKFAMQFGGRAEPRPTAAEFDALRRLTAEQLLVGARPPARLHVDFNDLRDGYIAGLFRAVDAPPDGCPVELYDADGNTMAGTVVGVTPRPRGRVVASVKTDPDTWRDAPLAR